jgi:hypothetical protein
LRAGRKEGGSERGSVLGCYSMTARKGRRECLWLTALDSCQPEVLPALPHRTDFLARTVWVHADSLHPPPFSTHTHRLRWPRALPPSRSCSSSSLTFQLPPATW